MTTPVPPAGPAGVEPAGDGGGVVSGGLGPEAEPWPEEAAEAAFWAEARERGEPAPPPAGREDEVEDAAAGGLPALDGLVERIPADVRAALDDLFRARFVRVSRVPRKALPAAPRRS